MKYIILFISVLLCAGNVSANDIIAQADSAYTHDEYSKSVELYNQAITELGTSSLLYYNLGNAYFRTGQLGKAIVCYERAIILDPQNEDAKINLEFVNSKIIDRPGDNGTFISNTINGVISKYHSNTWATFSAIAFIVMLFTLVLYFFSDKIILRKIGFFGALILLSTIIITIIFSVKSATNANTHNKAIIITPSTILSTSPRIPKDRTEEAMLLHEGTKIEIIDSVSDGKGNKWYDAKIDNNHRAWVNSSAIEII